MKNVEFLNVNLGEIESELEVIISQGGVTLKKIDVRITGDSSQPNFEVFDVTHFAKPITGIAKSCHTTKNFLIC